MPHRVDLVPSAVRELASLPKSRQLQLARHIEALTDPYEASGVVKLQGAKNLYRKRVGDFRILFSIDNDKNVVTVAKIAHRRDAYQQR